MIYIVLIRGNEEISLSWAGTVQLQHKYANL